MTDGERPGRPNRSPGIREIANALGISIGTVDRALHDRPGISPVTREKVLSMAKSLAYQPNLAARYLSSRKQLTIAVALPREIASFWSLVRSGIQDAARPVETTGVKVLYRFYPRLGEGEVEALEECLNEDVHGVVIAPGEPEQLERLIAGADARGIPVMCVNTDAPGTARLSAVAVDPVANGSLVGELMGRFLQGHGPVAVITGLLTTIDHARKLDGFGNTLRELWPGLQIAGVVEAHDDESEAYRKCRDLFAAYPHLAGVYVSTANSLPVLQAIEDEGLAGKVLVITTDLFPALLPHIRSGRVAATIHQRPWTQGRIVFQALHRFLVEGLTPSSFIGLSPHIIMKSNLTLLLNRIRSGWGEEAEDFAGAPETSREHLSAEVDETPARQRGRGSS
jgi:LacI family transcriptional regulator, galactose operon repressor